MCAKQNDKESFEGEGKKEFAIIKTPPLNMKNRKLQLEEHY